MAGIRRSAAWRLMAATAAVAAGIAAGAALGPQPAWAAVTVNARAMATLDAKMRRRGHGQGARRLLAGLNDPDLAQLVTATVASLNAEAAALIANPLVDHTGQTPAPSTPPATTPPATRSPAVGEGASLLSNSGFEAPPLPPGSAYQTVTAGDPPGLGAWTVQKGSVDVVAAPGARAAAGGQFIDLNGNDTSDGPGIITQDVAVTAGRLYRLSFQLAGNPNGDPPMKTLRVQLGDREQEFTFDTTGHTNDELGWVTHTMQYAACGGASSVTVTFASTTEGSRGPNLDNVVLAEGGEASCSGGWSLWLLAAAVALLLAAAAAAVIYLRRRAAASLNTTA